MSRQCHNLLKSGRGTLQHVALGMHVGARGERWVGVPEAIGDDRDRHGSWVATGKFGCGTIPNPLGRIDPSLSRADRPKDGTAFVALVVDVIDIDGGGGWPQTSY